MEASSRRVLTKRIGTHAGSNQKLILSLIIVTELAKRRALHAVLGEIGVIFSATAD